MTIKHVLLDVYNLVQKRDKAFVAKAIEVLATNTRLPWEECAYAFAESTQHFRSLDPDGAFVCKPTEFANDVISRLENTGEYDGECYYWDLVHEGLKTVPEITEGSVQAMMYLWEETDIGVTFIANTNILPLSSIYYQLGKFEPLGARRLLMQEFNHVQMPHDRAWLRAMEEINTVDEDCKPGDVLFVTTNGKYATMAERAGFQIAVLATPDELLPALKRRIEAIETPSVVEGKRNALLG